MLRISYLALFTLGLLSSSVLVAGSAADNSDYFCKNLAGEGEVNCNTFNHITESCHDRCCLATGLCSNSACDATFNTPDANSECAGPCKDKIICTPVVDGCDDNQEHCLGVAHCVAGTDCDGRQAEGAPCLYSGTSHNFKVCAPGSITGDPQFIGLRGQDYQVHGVSGDVYNIVSDPDLQYNSRFVFLSSGKCPIVNGVRMKKGCWSHPGSYLGELGLKTRAGDRIHIVSGDESEGFDAIEFNGKTMEVGDSVMLADRLGSVSYNTTHMVEVDIGSWSFVFENSDRFINQRVRVSVSSLDTLRSHGLLGQTWREKTYKSAIKHIMGTVDDYTIRNGDIFGDDFLYNAHN